MSHGQSFLVSFLGTLVFLVASATSIDAAVLIRQKELDEKLTRVPIIALTGHSNANQCLTAGMDDFLQKPALMDDLKGMILKWGQQ